MFIVYKMVLTAVNNSLYPFNELVLKFCVYVQNFVINCIYCC